MFPHRLGFFFAIGPVLFWAFGCVHPNTESAPTSAITAAEIHDSPAVTELKTKISRDGFVTFHNFEGKFTQVDGDIDLRLLQNGKAALIYNSLSINRADGSYELDACGTLFTKFDPEPFLGWPVLRLTRDAKSLVLHPSNGDEEHGAKGVYTFRPIRSKSETNFKD